MVPLLPSFQLWRVTAPHEGGLLWTQPSGCACSLPGRCPQHLWLQHLWLGQGDSLPEIFQHLAPHFVTSDRQVNLSSGRKTMSTVGEREQSQSPGQSSSSNGCPELGLGFLICKALAFISQALCPAPWGPGVSPSSVKWAVTFAEWSRCSDTHCLPTASMSQFWHVAFCQ